MTRDDIIRLIESNELTLHGDIEHFAHLVAAAERKNLEAQGFDLYRNGYKQGAKDEREHAAELCEQMGIAGFGTLAIAATIRARGGKNA